MTHLQISTSEINDRGKNHRIQNNLPKQGVASLEMARMLLVITCLI